MSSEGSAVPARARAREALREALLEAAEQVFADAGFQGATMGAIAARAGYSAGHLYNVFANKEALFREVVDWRSNQALERLGRALGEGPLLTVLDRFLQSSLAFFQENRLFFVLYIRETSGFEWNQTRLGEELRVPRFIDREIEGHIRAAMEAGEIPPADPFVCTCSIVGTLHHYLTRWIQSGGSDEELWAREPHLRAVFRRILGLEATCAAVSS